MKDNVKSGYLNYLAGERGLSAKTIDSYSTDLDQFLGLLFGDDEKTSLCVLENIDPFLFLSYLTANNISSRSQCRKVSALKSFYGFLELERLISKNPFLKISIGSSPRTLPKFLSEEQVDLLLGQPDIKTLFGLRDRLLLELLYATGLRVSELCAVKFPHIDFSRHLIYCAGKGQVERYVPFGQSADSQLKKYLEETRILLDKHNSDYLILNRFGNKISRQMIWRLVKRYGDQAGFSNVSPHTLRHSFATHLLARGADIRTVQILLGHRCINTTQVYTHVQTAHLKQMMQQFHPRSK